MELMPAWPRLGYEKGIVEGKAEGIAEAQTMVVRKMLAKGLGAAQVADMPDLTLDEVEKLSKR